MDELEKARACAEKMLRSDRASQALGIEMQITQAGAATATMCVRDDMVNGFDVCHGGIVFALADTAFAFACNSHDQQAVAASAQIEFLRPANSGDVLRAVAQPDHTGRRSGYYTVTIHNQHDQPVGLFRGRSVMTGRAVLDE